jgi:nicotinamide-nucleotide amidase
MAFGLIVLLHLNLLKSSYYNTSLMLPVLTTATIITIGDELLIGQVIDTNSAWMAQELNKAGITVRKRVAVGDTRDAIWMALEQEMPQAHILLLTGGLGPTADDITKPLLCEFFGGKMVQDEAATQNVINIFNRLGRPIIERNLKQGEVPDVCTVLQNRRGTAPGMWFEKDHCIVVSMPGVPHEMKGMMETDVIPMLAKRFTLPFILHRTLLTAGVGESFLAEKLIDFEAGLPAFIKLAYLPNYGMVRLRLSATGADEAVITSAIDAQFELLQSLVKDHMVTNRDEPLEKVVGRLLMERGQTLTTAESCTGGYMAHLITAMPGASVWYKGSVIAYSNTIKQRLLRVAATTLDSDGAVSEATVRQMAAGALAQMNTDYAVAVSGIMGPDGGSAEKPVGLVWIAAASRTQTVVQHMQFRFDRSRNIQLTATAAFNLLRQLVIGTATD